MGGASRRFLMAVWDGGGNVPPELGVARRLVTRGHHVHVLGDPTLAAAAEAARCTFTAWERAPHRSSLAPSDDVIKDWETENPLVLLRRARDRLIAGPADRFAADTAEAVNAFAPDVVVSDAFLFGAVIAAQAASLPVALLVPNIWVMPVRGTPPIGPGFPPAKTVLGRARDAAVGRVADRLFSAGLPAVNAARAGRGLAPLRSFYHQALSAQRILVLSSPAFDYAADSVPPNVTYVGPILDEPDWTEPWSDPWSPTDERPLVLVAFSSTYQAQGPLLRRVVEALSTLPVRALVTVGPMLDPGEVEPAGNVAVVPSAPHGAVLAGAALAVSHCGHGTTMKALAAGVPMVCIPMGRDQNDTAARVVHHGAGVRLPPAASATRVRAAVLEVLHHDAFRTGAGALAARIAEDVRAGGAERELEALAG